MFNISLKITAFSLFSVLATASAHAGQGSLLLHATNTVLEGAPLYSNQKSEDKTVTTYLNKSNTSVKGELHLLPTFSVQEGSALYSYQEIKTDKEIVQTITTPTFSVDKSQLQLLPTNSVLEGDALYSYQEVKTKGESPKVYAEVTKSDSKTLKVKINC
jgi:hypothetical protein